MTTQATGWASAFKAFLDRRALIMLFLGFSAGIPILLIFSSLSLWLGEAGIDTLYSVPRQPQGQIPKLYRSRHWPFARCGLQRRILQCRARRGTLCAWLNQSSQMMM